MRPEEWAGWIVIGFVAMYTILVFLAGYLVGFLVTGP